MNVLTIVKGSASLVTGLGASMITGAAIKKVLPASLSKAEKILIAAGTFGIGGAVGTLASDYVEELTDSVFAAGERIVSQVKGMKG